MIDYRELISHIILGREKLNKVRQTDILFLFFFFSQDKMFARNLNLTFDAILNKNGWIESIGGNKR